MGRPKLYEDRAEKMRAYRARRAGRVVEIDRYRVESMDDRLTRLRASVVAAQEAGSKEAGKIDTITLEDTIEGVIALFDRLRDAMAAQVAAQEGAAAAAPAPVVPARDLVARALKRNVTIPDSEPEVKYTLPKKGRGRAR